MFHDGHKHVVVPFWLSYSNLIIFLDLYWTRPGL